jgi:hypothetical protein
MRTINSTSGRRPGRLAAVVLAVVLPAALAAVPSGPASADGAAPEPDLGVVVSQTEPDPNVSPAPVAVDDTAAVDGVSARTTGRAADRAAGCATGYRWMKLCGYAGYPMSKRCGAAWCGLLGTLSDKKGKYYRVDMRAGASPKRFKAEGQILASRKKKRRCAWGAEAAREAAFVLSRHGDAGANSREAAAVDLAVTDRLCGGKWAVGGRATAKRLRASGAKKGVRGFVKNRAAVLVDEAKAQSGPYTLTASASDAAVGERVTVTATVNTRTGHAAPNRTVQLTLPTLGMIDAVTNSEGIATWTFTTMAGTTTGTVTAPGLEADTLYVRRAKRKSASRIVAAARKQSISTPVSITTKQRPTLSVSVADARIPNGIPANFTYSNSVGDRIKVASFKLYGPFGNAAGSSCGTQPIATDYRTFQGNKTVDISGWMPGVSGYYRIAVYAPGDDQNTAASACSSPLFLYGAQTAIVGIYPTTDQIEAAGSNFTSYFDYAGGYGNGGRYWHATLWGPFDTKSQSSCDAGEAKKRKQYDGYVTGNGRYNFATTSVAASNAGWYRWGITVNGDASNDPTGACGGAFQIVSFGG